MRNKTLFLIVLCVVLLALPLIVSAQEEGGAAPETPVESNESPAGLGLLMLLIGIGCIVFVGGAMIGRDIADQAQKKSI